jgi:hypothetical protein
MVRKNASKKPLGKRPSKKPTLAQRIDSLRQRYGISKADAETIVRIRILPPAVRPLDISPRAIREAVRRAMREEPGKGAHPLEPK